MFFFSNFEGYYQCQWFYAQHSVVYIHDYRTIMNRINTNRYKKLQNGILHSFQARTSNKLRPLLFIPVHQPPFDPTLVVVDPENITT
jgi:hypothetical protein